MSHPPLSPPPPFWQSFRLGQRDHDLSRARRTFTAVPSARNSGFEMTWKSMPAELAPSTRNIASAVRTGTVDFSTTIFGPVATSAMVRAQASQFFTSAAHPAPFPCNFVGVFTDTKMMSARSMPPLMSVEKKRFRSRHDSTSSCRPCEVQMQSWNAFPLCQEFFKHTYWLVDGQRVRVPRANAIFRQIDYGNTTVETSCVFGQQAT